MVNAILFWSIMMNLLKILDWKVGPEHKIFSLGLTLFPGYKVRQLRMLLQSNCLNNVDLWFSTPLGYVQWFKQRQGFDDPANMFIYSCNLNFNDKWKGEIIPISTIHRQLQLVPWFSGTTNSLVINADTSLDKPNNDMLKYSLNPYVDKELY